MKISATLYSRCRPGRQDKESVEQQQQGGYDRYEEQQLWEKVYEELFVCKQFVFVWWKLVVWLFIWLVVWNKERQLSRESLWKVICIVTQGGQGGSICFCCWMKKKKMTFLHAWCHLLFWVLIFLTDKKEASAIKGQWSDTWLQAMVWNTRLGARRSQVGWEEGPQLRQKQELLIFSTIDSLQRSHNNWQHACVIFPLRENIYHGVKYFFLLWWWIYFIYSENSTGLQRFFDA